LAFLAITQCPFPLRLKLSFNQRNNSECIDYRGMSLEKRKIFIILLIQGN
jgi:hypothetical protein